MSLKKEEWPPEILKYMSTEILGLAFNIRKATGCCMIPSPDPEAHVRFTDGKSRHCIGADKSKKSFATDVFLNPKQVVDFWINAQRVSGLGGFGLYFDTRLSGEDRPLAHIDLRSERLLWICPSRDRKKEKRQYIYLKASNPLPYFKALGEELAKLAA